MVRTTQKGDLWQVESWGLGTHLDDHEMALFSRKAGGRIYWRKQITGDKPWKGTPYLCLLPFPRPPYLLAVIGHYPPVPKLPSSQMNLTICPQWSTQLQMKACKAPLSTVAQECLTIADILASLAFLSLTKHPGITTLLEYLCLKLSGSASEII